MTGVAIVIPMLNEAAGLPRVLRSLAALEPPPAEVLAVDGGSTDASVAIAEAAALSAREKGISPARLRPN
jgi:glycosyltransferase involved in cell wall biosynthesis